MITLSGDALIILYNSKFTKQRSAMLLCTQRPKIKKAGRQKNCKIVSQKAFLKAKQRKFKLPKLEIFSKIGCVNPTRVDKPTNTKASMYQEQSQAPISPKQVKTMEVNATRKLEDVYEVGKIIGQYLSRNFVIL
jgi:hypothetical protein